jgi:hypothetical protein
VAVTSPANNAIVNPPVTVQGTHTLPSATFDRDEAGDGLFPDHGPVIGTNVPALDIRQVDMTENATNIIVHMQVADATTAALAAATGTGGGDGLLYLVQWDYNESTADPIDRVFWVAAEVRAGQALGRTGTLGVIRSATSKKYITYNPDAVNSLQVTATISNTAPGTITLTIPRSLVGNPPNGAVLNSVTGYAMSERGPLAATPCPPAPASCENIFDPTSLPIHVDSSGAFSYIVGAGMQLDGVVQVSLDDPSFSFPVTATANVNGTWQNTFTTLNAGQHTVYARQVVRGGCATSPTASVSFTIPGPPAPVDVVSHKIHGASFTGDIHLLPPNPGIEMRRNTGTDVSPAPNAGRDHELIITFPVAVTASGVTITTNVPGDSPAPTGNIVAGNGTANITVDLHNIQNPRRVTVTLNGVTDGAGNGPGPVPVLMGVLLGDRNSNTLVNSTDTSIVQSQSGQALSGSNFPSDVNVNGLINSTDTSIVQSKSGTGLP